LLSLDQFLITYNVLHMYVLYMSCTMFKVCLTRELRPLAPYPGAGPALPDHARVDAPGLRDQGDDQRGDVTAVASVRWAGRLWGLFFCCVIDIQRGRDAKLRRELI
jgi:hypothetical protein